MLHALDGMASDRRLDMIQVCVLRFLTYLLPVCFLAFFAGVFYVYLFGEIVVNKNATEEVVIMLIPLQLLNLIWSFRDVFKKGEE